MNTAAILSIKPVYANRILEKTKTIELRKSSLGLRQGDVVLVYSSLPEQQLSFWFRVKGIESAPVETMWQRHADGVGIGYDDYAEYFQGSEFAVGLHIGELHELIPIPLREIESCVPGFVPPQGIIWLRDEFGKYRELLSRLSAPLPEDVFPQQCFNFEPALRA